MAWKVAFCVVLLAVVAHLLVDPFDISSLTKHKEDFLHRSPFADLQAGNSSSLSQVLFDASTSVAGFKRLVAFLESTTNARALMDTWVAWVALAFLASAPWTLSWAYDYFCCPLEMTVSLEDVERRADGKKYPPWQRPRRLRGAVPPPYPNAWYKVCNSHDIPKGESRDFELLGHFFAVYRGEDGKVRILDAYCPHMGANLGVTGRVVGNEIACPFHGWQFDGEGKCTHIPYAEKVPGFMKTNSWPSTEMNGSVMLWHDAEGRPPLWMPSDIKEINSGRYKWHGAALHQVRAHIQEIPENGPDTAHLNYLHVPLVFRLLSKSGFHHAWEATWEPGKGVDEHLAFMRVIQSVEFRGRYIPGTRIDVDIVQVGPSMVHLHFATPFGKVMLIETVTPVQPLLQRITHQVFAEWTVPRFFAKFIMGSTIVQFERDVPIWNNKTYLNNPGLVKEDGPIAKYRRWFTKNFYSENSEKVARDRAAATGSIDW